MRKFFIRLFMLAVFLGCSQICLSQHPRGDLVRGKSFTQPPVAIADLQHSLKTVSSPKKKADILYELANKYLAIFKVDSSIFYSRALLEISRQENYALGIGKYHLANAGACFLRNRGEDVLKELDTAILIFQSEHSDLYLGLCYRLKGRQFGQVSNNVGAQHYYRQAIAFLQKAGDQNYLQRALHDFGRNFYFSFEVDSAALYLTQALKMAEQMNDSHKMFNTATILGSVYLLANEFDNAAKTLKFAFDVCPPDADKIQLRAALANYAEAFILTDRFTEAEKALAEHTKINAKLGDITGELNDKKLKGFLLYRQGKNKEALQYLSAAYNLKEKLGKTDFDITTIALYLGACELNENMTKQAIDHFHHARYLSGKYNFIATAMDANRLLAQAFEQLRNTDSAYYYFQTYTSIKDSIFKNNRDKTILELSARYNAEKKEYQINELEQVKQLQDKTIQAQQLIAEQRRQQLALVTQQSEVNRLRASEQSLALQTKNKEFLQKQKELELAQKESRLQQRVAKQESRNKRLLVIIIMAGLVTGCYGVYRYRQTENMRKQLAQSLVELKQAQAQLIQVEKQNEAQNIRQRISRDIHDEVGATLSGVVLFSEIARQKIAADKDEDAGEYLDHIYSNSKDMLEKMSDIVWAINPKNDSFERIIFKLRTYAMNLCIGKGIALHFAIEEALFEFSVTMQARKNIYLLIKEALNNAIKYSMANNIYFSMKSTGSLLQIEIRDDGKGFQIEDQQDGNGIGNMRARARELGSDLIITSSPVKGTCISLQFQFHPIVVRNEVPA